MTALFKTKKFILLSFLTVLTLVGVPTGASNPQKEILDDDSLLLVFSLGTPKSRLLLIGKNDSSEFVLPPRIEIENSVEKLLRLLESREPESNESIEEYQTRITDADKIYRIEARNLSNALFGQISGQIAGKRLIIVPDGKLRYFPVAVLPMPHNKNDVPILLTNEAIYEPTLKSFFQITENSRRNTAEKDLLVFSDPVFSVEDSRFSPSGTSRNNTGFEKSPTANPRFAQSLNNLPRLFASGEEGNSAAGFFKNSMADVFSGFSATRERALNPEISNYKIIHFATHGLIDNDNSESSGIVLSAFDETGRKLEQVISLQDISSLKLNADLVVLSACQTGVGKETGGDGLHSLSDGFLRVGAKSVLASLWKIDDNSAKVLMRDFYQGLAEEKLTASQALRQAQIKMMNHPQFNSPFYWAAFTVQGDYRVVPQISTGFDIKYLLLPIPLIMFSGFALTIIRRQNRK